MSIISRFHVENPTRGIKPIDFVTISHVGRRVRRLAKAINTCIGRRWANSSHHHWLSWTISATLALTNTSVISAIVWWISRPYPCNHLSFQNLTCLSFPTDQPVPSIIWGDTLQMAFHNGESRPLAWITGTRSLVCVYFPLKNLTQILLAS